jgi:hypothetical protein
VEGALTEEEKTIDFLKKGGKKTYKSSDEDDEENS